MDFSLRKIASHYLLTPQGFQARPLITIKCFGDHSHEIVAVEQYDERLDSMAGVEFHSGILCAGFVNAHSHIELSYLRGAIAEGGGFASFAESIGRVRGAFSEEERLSSIAEADKTMWQEFRKNDRLASKHFRIWKMMDTKELKRMEIKGA